MHRDLRLDLATARALARGAAEASTLLAHLDHLAGADAGAGAGHAGLAARLRDVDAELEAARQRLRTDLEALAAGGASICRDFASVDAELAGASERSVAVDGAPAVGWLAAGRGHARR